MNWMLPGRSTPHIVGLIAVLVLAAQTARAEEASSGVSASSPDAVRSVQRVDERTQESQSRGPKNSGLIPGVLIGPRLSVAVPTPTFGVEAKILRYFRASFDYGLFPKLNISGVDVGYSMWNVAARVYPIYGISKAFLAVGALPPFVLHINLPRSGADGGLNRSVYPAVRTRGEEFSDFGTEYFLSSFDQGVLENQVVAWSLSNTVLLNLTPGPHTKFSFQRQPARSETSGVPPDALQKIGTLPLGSLVNPTVRPSLATNAQNMQQVTFTRGRLWSTVSTVLNSPEDTVPAGAFGDPNKAGVAWFAVKVDNDHKLKAKVDDQGYVAIKNANLLFPAVGINHKGQAAIAFSISGPDFFPSAGYVQSREDDGFGRIHIAAAGVNSEDGFTAYPSQNPGAPCNDPVHPTECEARWGDYGAAAIGGDGSIWLASEYIGPRPRSAIANWGTFITRLSPGDDDDHHDDSKRGGD